MNAFGGSCAGVVHWLNLRFRRCLTRRLSEEIRIGGIRMSRSMLQCRNNPVLETGGMFGSERSDIADLSEHVVSGNQRALSDKTDSNILRFQFRLS